MTTSIHHRQRGFTLIEAVVCILIVGVMTVAALKTVGAARFGQWKTAGQARAEQLGSELLEEIQAKRFEDPDQTPSFGPESGESQTNDRATLDDVDDYHQLTDTVDDFDREVTVRYVKSNAPGQKDSTEETVKRITVTVRNSGVMLAKVVALKSKAGDDDESQ